jgi:hypothetical protein
MEPQPGGILPQSGRPFRAGGPAIDFITLDAEAILEG